ncbi:MAG: SCO family protein [Sphaerospermopsis kisseleviana]
MTRVILLCLLALLASCSANRRPGEGLPFYDSADFTPRWSRDSTHRVGDFTLTSQTGAPLSGRDLRGRMHVASFFFTTCTTICPLLVDTLGRAQSALAGHDDVVMVSYSVTPTIDTPAVLEAFGKAHGIDPARWSLLTGPADDIYRLARESYFADDRRLDLSQPAATQILHTEKVLLVDHEGHLRGVYNGTVPFDIDRLVGDIDTLRREHDASAAQ